MTPQAALQRTIELREIFHDEMIDLMRQIMQGKVSPVMIAAIITGLRVKKETIGEIAAAAEVMREMALPVDVADRQHLVDTCGTGGDGAHTFNISTAAMFVAAAGGAKIAKHGSRSISSHSGSADVLESLGAAIALSPEKIAKTLDAVGIGFMFAPAHHRAMQHAALVRKEMGVRTLFNILGPLTNPAKAERQVMGVFHADLVGIQIRVLQRLGCKRALTLFGKDGLDEISICAPTMVGEIIEGRVCEYEICPEQFGVPRYENAAIQVQTPEESKFMLLSALNNDGGAARDIVALNAGAILYVAGLSDTLEAAVAKAFQLIAEGRALAKMNEFILLTQKLAAC